MNDSKKTLIGSYICIVTMAIIAIACVFIINFKDDEIEALNIQVETLQQENEELETQIDELNDFKRTTVVNNFWEYTLCREALYGNIYFDDLSIVENINVSYIDVMFNKLEVAESSVCIDYTQNKAVVTCLLGEELAKACVLDIEYIDGRLETIYVCIAMG